MACTKGFVLPLSVGGRNVREQGSMLGQVRFRSSKGDQLRNKTVMTRARVVPPLPLRDGGSQVDRIAVFLYVYFLPRAAGGVRYRAW